MYNTLNITKNLINKYNLRADKRYGQNFLIDDIVLDDIVKVSEVTTEDLVIEIGPGLGNLTEYFINRCKFAILIEIDQKMTTVLKDRLKSHSNYMLLNDDIMKVDLCEIIKKVEASQDSKFRKIKVISNLPYYITTPILFKLLENNNKIDDLTVMVQKEVAERMVAIPKNKDYSILTVMIKYLSEAKIKIIVDNKSFIPSPNVISAVVHLEKRKRYKVLDEKILFELVHLSFAKRRKKMINSLALCSFRNIDKNELGEILNECGLSENARAEEVEIEKYIEISDYLTKINK